MSRVYYIGHTSAGVLVSRRSVRQDYHWAAVRGRRASFSTDQASAMHNVMNGHKLTDEVEMISLQKVDFSVYRAARKAAGKDQITTWTGVAERPQSRRASFRVQIAALVEALTKISEHSSEPYSRHIASQALRTHRARTTP